MKATRRPLVSIRLIVAGATATLVAAAVLGAGAVSERNTRQALTREIETRLVLEARNLALTGAGALLSQFPELTLTPLIRKMQAERPELAFVVVLDHRGLVQGHADPRRLGESFAPPERLTPVVGTATLQPGERLLGNAEVLVVETPVSHPSEPRLGQAVVGVRRAYAEQALLAARRTQVMFLAVLLAVGVALALVLMNGLLGPIATLRTGLERIGRGDLETPLTVRGGTELGLLADTVNDMTGRLRAARTEVLVANQELRETNRRLTELDRLKSEFLRNVNHELRTPLTIIAGNLEVIERAGAQDPRGRRALEASAEQADKLARLLENLLDFAELGVDGKPHELQACDLAAGLGDHLATRRDDLAGAGRQLEFVAEAGLPAVACDPRRLVQIVDELVNNAVKFTPPGSRITVRVAAGGTRDRVRVEVQDDGPGIPAARLPLLFEAFRQGDGSTTRAAGGLGLGLALARRWSESMGGTLEVSNLPTRGCVFRLLLPVAMDAQAA